MTLLGSLLVAAAGFGAGMVNTMVGSGSLITYPTLVALGFSPVAANIANTVGLVPGSLSGVVGYRRELAPQREIIRQLLPVTVVGAAIGACLLLWLPPAAFEAIVPGLILLASALVGLQPLISRRLAPRRRGAAPGVLLTVAVFAASVYGGYFSAAQGVIILGILGLLVPSDIQQHNALKNLLQAVVNVIAAVVFAFVFPVNWAAAGLIAAGSLVGAQLGAVVARMVPASVLRTVVVAVGVTAATLMIL